MRVVQITAGSGNSFYCANCLRDAALARAMNDLGHDVIIMPMYLPGQFEGAEEATDQSPLFFGGINVYLQQKMTLFRHTPRWVDRLFDSPLLLKLASRQAGATSARSLGETIISMLKGPEGRQAKELKRLVGWLNEQEHDPDVVCLSNVLLAGLAGAIQENVGVPVITLLQDEDEFLDSLEEPLCTRAWDLLRACCSNIDGFISSSCYYASAMSKRLGISTDRMHTVFNGICLDGIDRAGVTGSEPVIGYLSRMSPDKGLDLLVEAYINLRGQGQFDDLRLKITGGKTKADEAFIREVQNKVDGAGLSGDVHFMDDFGRAARERFFDDVTVLSVPEKKPVSNSRYVLESLARSVPVVQPNHGIFPELLDRVGGGLLFEPGDVGDLGRKLARVLCSAEYARELGRDGHAGVAEHLDIRRTAENIADIYRQYKQPKRELTGYA